MIRKICEFSLSLNDVQNPDWGAVTTMPADLVNVRPSVLSQDGLLVTTAGNSKCEKGVLTPSGHR
ncbi:hypothetical protein OUZ56_022348 [Daphnia magna]|uniref:Uncharacterized protein n=1 Tax=Daphnia magna TaxID=35525 RepID=A0ABR0AW39_9CRUS|nr:hypothetical protein OUZ56_022348 [Daphnia magna]